MDKRIRVAVVGAGIAGLATAYRLTERGFHVAVFDQRLHVGGKMGAHRGRMVNVKLDRHDSIALATALDEASDGAGRVSRDAPGGSSVRALSQLLRELRRRLHVRRALLLQDVPHGGNIEFRDLEVHKVLPPTHNAEQEWSVRNANTLDKVSISRYAGDAGENNWEISDGVDHEHCYHMYLNWYLNFWALMQDIGCERSECFKPENCISHMRPGVTPVKARTRTATRQGALDAAGDTLLSGLASIPDTFLWLHSYADLAGRSFNSGRYLDQESVHGYMGSRWYATEKSVKRHEHVLSKAFAIPAYLSSAAAYGKFTAFSAFEPDPMLWVMRGNSYRIVFQKFENVLAGKQENGHGAKLAGECDFELGRSITALIRDADGRVTGLEYEPSDMRGRPRRLDDGEQLGGRPVPRSKSIFKPDYVVLAVPPQALADLVEPFREQVPGLVDVRKLQSGVTAALDLHFNRRIDLDIPGHPVLAIGSRYGLTFIDNSQCWDAGDPSLTPDPHVIHENCTCLNVAATDFYKLQGMRKDDATRAIIDDLKRFLPFDDKDIDYHRTYLQLNDREPLFVNEVGSERWRPGAFTDIPNLFLAGDYCENETNAVSVEGAVITGLLAARAVQARAREDRGLLASDPVMQPIEIFRAEVHPNVNLRAFKLMLSPYAAGAKMWSDAESFARHPGQALSPGAMQAAGRQWLSMPAALAEDWVGLVGEGAGWIAGLSRGE